MAHSDMLTLLLFILLSQVNCDWVEISQQHYVKPAPATRVYPQISVKEVERTTKANRVFVNNSLPSPGWNKGAVYKVPSSEVKKLIDSEVVRSKTINFEEDKSELDQRKIFVGPTKPTSKIRKRPNEENNRYNGHVFYNKDNVKRITFTSTEESLKPLEVLNLSDLGYDEDEFPTIEVDDVPLNGDQFEHTRHVTSVISTEEEVDNVEKLLNTSLKGSKYSYSTSAPSKIEDVKVTNESSATKVSIKKSVDQNAPIRSRKETNDSLNLKTMNNSKSENRNKIALFKDKTSNHSKSTNAEKIKEEVLEKKKNNLSSQSTTQRTQDAKSNESSKITDKNKLRNNNVDKLPQRPLEKPTPDKLKLKKNVLRIEDLPMRSKTRNPEEVMLEEILHETDESFEDDNHRTAVEHTHTGTVKKTSNKSTITKVYLKKDKPGNNVGSKPAAESNDQGTDVKSTDNVNFKENINNYKKSVNTITTSSTSERPSLTTPTIPTNKECTTEKEIEEFDRVQLNSPAPTLVESSESDNNVYEEVLDFDISEEETQGSVQEDKKVLVSTTSTGNHKGTRTREKPIITEKTNGTNIEATTKASSMQQIKRTTDKNKETDRLDSKTPSKIDKNEQEEVKKQEDKTTAEETLANDTTADTLGILVKVLKLVTETISSNTRKTLKGKLRYLEELRDTIMASIEQRLEAAFPDDTPRRARSAPHARGHHVEFPSSESALMTISFLTFAVFLIKLVLQLIQAYKYKAMMPAVMATVGRAYQEYSKTKSK